MTYTPPAWQEWLTAAAILAAGVACLRLGIWSSHQSARARNVVAAAGVIIAVGAAAAHYPPLRDVAGAWMSVPGGEGVLACLGALSLLGVACSDPRRSTSRLIPAAAIVLIFILLISLGSASLGWRYLGKRLRANYPDASGALQQTTGITCAPAAASILLYQSGIRISEGELAELASTNPLQGTAPHALARAVDRAARHRGLRGCIQRVDYAQAMRLRHPFVAFVNRPGVGGHALCVLKVDATRVWAVDPLSGTRETILREEFVAQWDPTIIWVERLGR